MSGGWSRYTRNASSGRGTGCGASIVAGLFMAAAIGLAVHLLSSGDDCQNMTCASQEAAK